MPFLKNGNESIYYTIDLASEQENAELIILLHNNITDHTLFDGILPYLNRNLY